MNRIAVRPLTQTNRFTVLNVTEPGTRPCWFDTDGDKLACLLGHIGSQSECFLKRCSVCDDMIGRQNGHNRSVIASCYPAGAERDGGGCVALGRFGDDVFLWEIPEQFANCVLLFCVCQDQNALARDEALQARQRFFEQRIV